jgi:arabinoxylan arabinofuranohydrolase
MKRIITLLAFLISILCAKHTFADYPIVSHRYLADPAALVYNGRVYIYCSNDDENPTAGGYQMKSIVCVSSSDLKNWTDHGIVFQVPRDASWAGRSWAPSVIERDGMFYLYFGDGGSGIGVASADSPTGPFADPIDDRFVTSETPGVLPAENIWIFDPMTFIDDDGQAYMYFGGNGEDNMRVIRLNEDMISIDGSAMQFNVPYFFEASWMHKHNGTYYFSYSTNPANGMRIDYMTSDNPTSGFTYGGIVSPQPPNNSSNNNHHAIFEFNGTWYEAYHNRYVAAQAGIPTGYRRSLCLDSIYHKPDGSIQTMVNTKDGLVQVGYMNPYMRVEAETMNAQNGIYTEVCSEGGMNVTNIEDSDWIKVRGVDFGSIGAGAFTASIASDIKYGFSKGGSIEIRIDDIDGTLIGTVPVSYTGGSDVWKSETVVVDEVTGVHDVYFVFTGDNTVDLFNFDYWYFTEKTGSHDLLAINTSVEDYKIDTTAGNDNTIIKVNAVFTDGTSEDITSAVTFTFDPENIVSITDSIIHSLGYGNVTITASYNDSTDSVMVIVKNLDSELTVSQIYADSSDIELYIGGSLTIKITAEFEDDHMEDVTGEATYNSLGPEVATITTGVITAVGEGEVDITVRYQGDLGEEKSITIHVSVGVGPGIWLEAECGTVGSLWNITADGNASHDEYVTIKPGNESIDNAPTDAAGILTYEFYIEENGIYTVYTRVICPSANDDSFWLKMDDGSFAMWNGIAGSSSWIWTNFPTTYDLNAGNHTLTIGHREDGARLDKIWITTSGGNLTGEGSAADNCIETAVDNAIDAEIEIYPNPVYDEFTISLPDSPADISIYNIEGKQVIMQNINSMKMTINMANYNPGIYFLKITCHGQTVVSKIIHCKRQILKY